MQLMLPTELLITVRRPNQFPLKKTDFLDKFNPVNHLTAPHFRELKLLAKKFLRKSPDLACHSPVPVLRHA
jgi:hypothetical protein